MNVSSVTSTSALLQVGDASSSSDESDLTALAGTESSGVSQMADLMSQLKSLEESDPAKFKTVMTDLMSQMKEKAASADGGEKGFLKEMAQKFATAADSGNLSALQPPDPPSQGSTLPPMKAKAAYESNGQAPSVDIAQLMKSTLAQVST